eukprot:comp21049_c0_seq4/m.44243 comp21049_c0_seq4/g.44243  ORF comp21049_c0_seq4/g.44243 comp21049_c0_seq4/m.44243 type:complete len:416 (+) comp21049_c0_seq4:672-1919(+)
MWKLLLLWIGVASAYYLEGTAKAADGAPVMRYLGKFCYGDHKDQHWKLDLTSLSSAADGQLVVALYDEAFEQLKKAKGKFDCSHFNFDNKTVADFVPHYVNTQNGTVEVEIKDNARPRFWFILAVNCDKTGLDFKYKMKLTNSGGKWMREFSTDEQGLLPAYLIFMFVFLLGSGIHIYGLLSGWRGQGPLHPIVKLLTTAIFLETISIVCDFTHYIIFAGNGVGTPVMLGVGQVIDMGAQLVMMLLLILIAKGWTISSPKLTDRRAIFVFLALFLFGYVSLFIWEEAGINPESTEYLYESVPGIILLAMRGITMAWFIYCIFTTWRLESHPDKRKFYLIFGFLYTLWFIALPVIVAVASQVDPWVRAKTVTSLYLLFNMFAFAGMGWLLWPTRAHIYFKISAPDLLKGAGDYDKL